MTNRHKKTAICVLTAKNIDWILQDGGSQSWVLDANRARGCAYVVCVQNHRSGKDDWGHPSAPHHSVFLVGRLDAVVRATDGNAENRWLLKFSEYATNVIVADAWNGHRNPVFYTDLETIGIKVDELQFQPMPRKEFRSKRDGTNGPLTMTEAKEGLALMFGVSPSDIEITIRG